MNSIIKKVITNKLRYRNVIKYCAIIGKEPSKGARSPKLWNKVFKRLNIDAYFYNFDIKDDKSLKRLMEILKNDKSFIGGSVTIPYKETIVKYLDALSPEAEIIGAVNSIRRNNSGQLIGDNTDGKAALNEIKNLQGTMKKKSILLLGLGGAGIAVATYIANSGAKLSVWNRSNQKTKKFINKMKKKKITIYEEKKINSLKYFDAVINCTSFGFKSNTFSLGKTIIENKLFDNAKKNLVIFDIIYQPLKTQLLKDAQKKGFKNKNGLNMNLLQAVIAFKHVFPSIKKSEIIQIMKNV